MSQQEFLLTLTGVAIIDFKGTSPGTWRWDTARITPNEGDAVNYAIDRFGIPTPPGTAGRDWYVGFRVELINIFATLNAIYDQSAAVDAGFAVDRWRPEQFLDLPDAVTGERIPNIFSGILVDVAVRDSDAWLYRVGYQVTLLGKPSFTRLG